MHNLRDEREMTVEKTYVTWEGVENFIDMLKPFIEANNFTGVYGPARGGLVFAVMISHRFDLPFLGAPQPGCLIVDDIVDTGDTARAWANKGYKIAAMFYNQNSNIKIDYYMLPKGDNWIVYPWEERTC